MKKINLKSKYLIDCQFSMSSMTDIVFLLLIFFMITTSFDSIEGMQINLPKSKHSNVPPKSISVIINEKNEYIVNNQKLTLHELRDTLKSKINLNTRNPIVLIEADKNIPIDTVIAAANIAVSLGAKISLATTRD